MRTIGNALQAKAAAYRVSRRWFLGTLGMGGAAAVFLGNTQMTYARAPQSAMVGAFTEPENGVFTLPPLPYPYEALEPHIDAETNRFHHDAHHRSYVSVLNAQLENFPEYQGRSVVELLYNINDLPEPLRTTVRNDGGGHLNHTIFFATMGPGGGGEPVGALAQAINQRFGNFATFQGEMTSAALNQFGSGWAWLVLDGNGQLQVINRLNQDSPVMDGLAPLVGVDVWEHSYYLRYRNRRIDYVNAWWNVVNWEAVGLRYDQARGV